MLDSWEHFYIITDYQIREVSITSQKFLRTLNLIFGLGFQRFKKIKI